MCLQAPQLDALMNTETKSPHWWYFDSCNFGEHCVVEIFLVVCVIQWCLVSSLWCLPFLLTQTTSHTPLIPPVGTIWCPCHQISLITSILSLPTVKLQSFSRSLHCTSICFPGLLLVSVWLFSPQIYIMTLFRNHITTPGLIHTSSICLLFFHQTTDIYIYRVRQKNVYTL